MFFAKRYLRQLLNEAQNTNYEHHHLARMFWDVCIKDGLGEDVALFGRLNKAVDVSVENHQIILAGQKYLDLLEKQSKAEYAVC